MDRSRIGGLAEVVRGGVQGLPAGTGRACVGFRHRDRIHRLTGP